MKRVLKKKSQGKNHPEASTSVAVERNMGQGEKQIIKEEEKKPAKVVPDVVFREGTAKVGLVKGVTINLGNYQSARIDCSIVRIVKDDDREIMDELANISSMIDEQIEFETEQLEEEQETKKKKK